MKITGRCVQGGRAYEQHEIHPVGLGGAVRTRGRRVVAEDDADGLADPAPSAIALHRATDGAGRGYGNPHGGSVIAERAEGEQLVVTRDAFRTDARDVFPSPQSRGVHHCVAKRR